MYSKYKGITDRDYSLTPPPGYDGSRFRRRSDGRDDAFPLYGGEVKRPQNQHQNNHTHGKVISCDYSKDEHPSPLITDRSDQDLTCESTESCQEETTCCTQCSDIECTCHKDNESSSKSSKIMSFLHSLGNEEILLISLILLLSGGRSRTETDTILILALLLCVT